MKLYYAMGAGYGHLTRAKKVIEQLKLFPVVVVTNSQYIQPKSLRQSQHLAGIAKSLNKLDIITPPRAVNHYKSLLYSWIKMQIKRYGVDHLYLDSFPCGIKGEIDDTIDVEKSYVARILNWPYYLKQLNSYIHFKHSYMLEQLYINHKEWIKRHSQACSCLKLAATPVRRQAISMSILPKKYCLVVHSGPESEINQLLLFAENQLAYYQCRLPIILLAPRRPTELKKDIIYFNVHPAYHLIRHASIVVSGAGFNLIDEMKQYKIKHCLLPFPRKYDDQFYRAARYREYKSAMK